MKMIYFGQEAWEEQYVKEKVVGADVSFYLGTVQTNPHVADADAEMLSVFVNSHVGAAELDRFPKLKCIVTRSTGFDHIDLIEARKRTIVVSNVPSYGINTVAEFAFGLLLMLTRKLQAAHNRVAIEGSFVQDGLTGTDLAGKTLGLVGCGRIGVHTAKIAKGFGMRVLVYDVRQDLALAGETGFEYVSLDVLFAQADFISVHVPYNPQTHHLINVDAIGKMKKGVYIINTARGAIIDTEAVVRGLNDGIIAGVGLDVLEEEGFMANEDQLLLHEHPAEGEMKTVIANHRLIKDPRVIVTPHVAFDTNEAIRRILDTSIDDMVSFMKGVPTNTVS